MPPRARTSDGAMPRIMCRSTSCGRANSARAGADASGSAAVGLARLPSPLFAASAMLCSAGSSAKHEPRLQAPAAVRQTTYAPGAAARKPPGAREEPYSANGDQLLT